MKDWERFVLPAMSSYSAWEDWHRVRAQTDQCHDTDKGKPWRCGWDASIWSLVVTAKSAFLTNNHGLVTEWVPDGHRAFAGASTNARNATSLVGPGPVWEWWDGHKGMRGLPMRWVGGRHLRAEGQSSQGCGDTGGVEDRVGLSFHWYWSVSIFYKRSCCALLLGQ